MAKCREVTSKKIYMGRLESGSDLLEGLIAVCRDHNIVLGRIEALGAVRKAKIGYYNQEAQEYQFSTLDCPLEICNLVGNVSLKDGAPFVHAHVTLADETGKALGGHLAPGTIVFVCEFVIEAFEGPPFRRMTDKETKVPLWEIPD